MPTSSQSTKSLLNAITNNKTPPDEVIVLAEQLLEQKNLDPLTAKSVADILCISKIRILEKQLIHAEEKDKDQLIQHIIDICPHGQSRDSFIRLLLDRKVIANDVEQIVELANQASSVSLKNEYLEEASLCLFRQTIIKRHTSPPVHSEGYTLLVEFLFACQQLNQIHLASQERFINVTHRLIKFINQINSYAVFEELIKLVNKIEGREADFAKQTVCAAINLYSGITQALHKWFPFGAFTEFEHNAECIEFLNKVTSQNKWIMQTLQHEPVERVTLRGIRKPGVLKVIMLFPGVVKKFFLGDVYMPHYRNEAHALKLLNGNYAPKLLDSYINDGVGVIVCEKIDGITLLDQKITATPWHILETQITKICLTLHQHNLCHGDLSCENILQTNTGEFKLIDFESASIFDGQTCLDEKNITQLFKQLGRRYANSAL